jgi:hypothetical protein
VGRTSQAFLRDIREAGYEPDDPVALQKLRAVTSTMDELDLLEEAVRENGVYSVGSTGQPVANPAFAAINRHRALLDRLLASLFDDGPSDEEISAKRKAAARARWNKQRGRK